jgi:arylsulfatase A
MNYLFYSFKKKIQFSIRLASFILIQTCLSASTLHAQNPSKLKPNIIFILADDVGYYVPTVNGGQTYSTPNIDSMARHGINFTHCEGSPLCSPSRFMLLTGKYNFRNYSNWGYMSDSEKTFGNVMRDAGYVTGYFGKLQLQYKYATMNNWGWDRHVVFELTEDTMKYRRYKNPVLLENGYRIPDSVTANKYCDDVLTQKIFDFIDSNHNKPFFAYYSMSIGHDPFSPTPDDPEFAAWNPNNGISDPKFCPSMMKYMDKKVGEILNKLRTAGLDKTQWFFLPEIMEHPFQLYLMQMV